MRILKSQWLYTVMYINQKLRKQQNGEQNIEIVYTLCCSKEVGQALEQYDFLVGCFKDGRASMAWMYELF